MSGEDERRLYALMAAAEDTQTAVDAALVSLRAERVALAQQIKTQEGLAESLEEEVQRIDEAVATLEGLGERVGASMAVTVRKAVASSMQAAEAGHRDAVTRATHEAIAGAVGERAATLQATTERTAATATAVEGRLQRAAAGLGWRWMAMSAAGMVAAVAATVGVGVGVGWWQGERIEAQRATIERLTPEVERLEAVHAELKDLDDFEFGRCTDDGSVCVRVDERRRAATQPDDPKGSAVYLVWGSRATVE